jgi:hypothetical protein
MIEGGRKTANKVHKVFIYTLIAASPLSLKQEEKKPHLTRR